MQEINSFCTIYLTKFTMSLNGIWFAIETYCCDEPHTHFILSIQKGENFLYMIKKTKQKTKTKKLLTWPVFRHLQTEFIQTCPERFYVRLFKRLCLQVSSLPFCVCMFAVWRDFTSGCSRGCVP